MGCHNCAPSKPDDEAKPLKKYTRSQLRMTPQNSQSEFGVEKLYQSTFAKDSLDRVFKRILQTYQAKAIPFSQVSVPDSAHQSPPETALSSLDNSFNLQRELKLAAEVLPVNTGSSTFLFVNESDPTMLKAIIAGPAFTPYAHGLFEFDIFIQDSPDALPRIQFNTTGDGSVSFSAYLPNTGVIDLSSLNSISFNMNESSNTGATQSISKLVLSLQNLLRASSVFGANREETEGLMPDSAEGMREYKAYCNVIKYATIQHAMLEYLENGPPELTEFVQTYFYLKKDLILKECKKWLAEAQIDNGNYDNIVARYNPELAEELRNGAYFVRLNSLIVRLEEIITNLSIKPANMMMSGSLKRRSVKDNISTLTY